MVERFRCVECGNVLSVPVQRVNLPEPLPWSRLQHWFPNPPRLEPRTYAVDEAEYGRDQVPGTFVMSPGDVRGLRFVVEYVRTFCWSSHGEFGPCLACTGCGTLVACRTDDCDVAQETRFYPDMVAAENCGEKPDPVPDPFGRAADWDCGPEPPVAAGRLWDHESRPRPELTRTHWRIRGLRDEVYRDDPPA